MQVFKVRTKHGDALNRFYMLESSVCHLSSKDIVYIALSNNNKMVHRGYIELFGF